MKIKSIVWSEVQAPSEKCFYTHVIGQCPFGEITIDWKGWKDEPGYSVDLPWVDTERDLWGAYSLEDAKAIAQAAFEARVNACIEQDSQR